MHQISRILPRFTCIPIYFQLHVNKTWIKTRPWKQCKFHISFLVKSFWQIAILDNCFCKLSFQIIFLQNVILDQFYYPYNNLLQCLQIILLSFETILGGLLNILPQISIFGHFWPPKNVKIHPRSFQTKIIWLNQKRPYLILSGTVPLITKSHFNLPCTEDSPCWPVGPCLVSI